MASVLCACATAALLPFGPLLRPLSSSATRTCVSASVAPSSFQELRRLDDRCHQLESVGIDALSGFYEADKNTFALTPGRRRVSVTSTCCSLYAINAAPAQWRQTPLRVRECLDTLLSAENREDDTFQAVLLVAAARLMDPDPTNANNTRLTACIVTMLSARPLRRAGRNQQLSAYLRFWLAYSASLLPSAADSTPTQGASAVALTLVRSCDTAYDDLCRQLAFHGAGDTYSFDVVVLAYSLLTYVLVLDRLGGAAARERETDARDAAGTGSSLPPRNERLVRSSLAIIFAQMESGMWANGQPIILSRGAGNNVGNAYCFAPDMLASMLEVLPADLFRPHLSAITDHVTWLEEHIVEESLPTGAVLKGWRSNHLPPEGGPLGWCTAQALRCVSRLSQLTSALLCADVLAELGGMRAQPADVSAWARLLDSDLPAAGECVITGEACSTEDEVGDIGALATGSASGTTLKATIEERMIEPLAALSACDPLGRYSPSAGTSTGASACTLEEYEASASYSAILFGPPGTAKTTVVSAIAKRLGWAFVAIDTSSFLADGLTNVARRISDVFDQLMRLEKVVILFDEIEEFVLDRSMPSLTMESRLLTTAMLTKLADLRGRRKVAFFIATNRLTALDAAVTRPGRFDLQLFVGTPNLAARMSRFRAKLEASSPPVQEGSVAAQAASVAFESLLARRWETDAMFLTFLETERLAADAAALVAAGAAGADIDPTGAEELEAEFEQLLDSLAAVMTVRGTVRDDFLTSRLLSRI